MTSKPTTTKDNVLVDLFGAQVRKIIYAVYALIGVVLGSVQVWTAAVDSAMPTWLKGALAVYAYVGGAIGLTAAANARDKGARGRATT